MDDRELLELAAKGAGLHEHGWMGGSYAHVVDNTWAFFDPLNDDGDALRLAVKLRIKFQRHIRHPYVAAWNEETHQRFEELEGNCPYAATRRAIVRAAAEIGRTK